MKIVFYGTPAFAVPSLEILVRNGFDITVVTSPDQPSGRGLKTNISSVKKFALDNQLPVLQPVKLSDPGFLEQLRRFNPDIQVVVAFRYLPKSVWSLPSRGTFNLHASLLPQYRGAAPINWALMNGEAITGLTTFFIDDTIDTGNILFREHLDIGPFETAGELHDRMMALGAVLVLKTVLAIRDRTYDQTVQSLLIPEAGEIKTAPKLNKALCHINWVADKLQIHNQIRGLSPIPGAYCYLVENDEAPLYLKVLKARPVEISYGTAPGTIHIENNKSLIVSALNGSVELLEVQAEGRKRMPVLAFLNGLSPKTGASKGICTLLMR